jgi:hypothetical protein
MASLCIVDVTFDERDWLLLKFLSPFDAKQCVFRLFIHTESYLTFAIPMTIFPHDTTYTSTKE